jgi:hypothetical protein
MIYLPIAIPNGLQDQVLILSEIAAAGIDCQDFEFPVLLVASMMEYLPGSPISDVFVLHLVNSIRNRLYLLF